MKLYGSAYIHRKSPTYAGDPCIALSNKLKKWFRLLHLATTTHCRIKNIHFSLVLYVAMAEASNHSPGKTQLIIIQLVE